MFRNAFAMIHLSCLPSRLLRRVSLVAALITTSAVLAPAQAQTPEHPAAANRPKVGLVLSGGGARGGAHLGVLRVLEAMRVPVDIIVGTSAGSIIGAAYASGLSVADIEREMASSSTAALIRDFDRQEVPLRRKADADTNLVGPEIGIGRNGFSLPKGAIAGVGLEGVLRSLTRLQTSQNFDELPIRFRAVATDLATAEMVVIGQGNLAEAIRASMAVPAVVNPVTLNGRLLVDGGVVRNLPVDVARSLGADVVIAVNIGTPLLRQEQISSLVAVSDQITRILTVANVNRSIAELAPRDVLITPELGTISTGDFDRLLEAAEAGKAAAQALGPKLAGLAVDAATYARGFQQASRPERPTAAVIAEVRVTGADRSNPAVIRGAMQTQAGQGFDQTTADRDMKRIYGRGDFESATYWLALEPDGRQVLNVDVKEKSWGPQYMRFGLGLSSDFTGNAFFQLMASHRATWLDPLGAEWRNDINIGHTDRLRTEWHQPLDERQRVFVSGRAELERTPFDIYTGAGVRAARYRRDTYGMGVDIGVAVGPAYEFRLGLNRGRARLTTDTGVVPGSVLLPRSETGNITMGVKFDTLDNLRFPRTGHAGELQFHASRPALGTEDTYNKVTASYLTAFSSGRHALELAARGVKINSRDALPLYELSALGGFLNLSGLRTGELLGHNMAFGRATYTLRTSGPGFFDGAYLGVSGEIGRVSDAVAGPTQNKTVRGLALYVAVDTPLGPAYLGYGRASGSRNAFYLVLGQP